MPILLKSGKKYRISIYSKNRENFRAHFSKIPITENDLCTVYTGCLGKFLYIYTNYLNLGFYEILEFDIAVGDKEIKFSGKINHYNGISDKEYDSISAEMYSLLKQIISITFRF